MSVLNFNYVKVNHHYALANKTLSFDGLPVSMHLPSSCSLFNGMQRMVALVSSFIFSSVSPVLSQCAETNPGFSSSTFTKSSQLSTLVVFSMRNCNARRYMFD